MNKTVSALASLAVALSVLISSLVSASCKKAGPDPYREAALKAAAWIQANAIKNPDGLSWPSIPADPQSVTFDLYSGVPGVVLFFCQAFHSTGQMDYLDAARAGADLLISKMDAVQGAGLYVGLSGVAFALEEAFLATREDKYRRGSLACLDRIKASSKGAGAGIEWTTTTDIISGNAGTGLFLIYAFHETGDRAWLDLAAGAGSRLIELARPENGGLKWAMDPEFPRLMPNFSHGTAGIAYFLAALYRETKRREFLDAALSGAKYLLSVAKTDGESCLIFHDEPDNKDLFYLGWCHGPVGTARLFYLLSRVTGEKDWLDWVRKSANGLLRSGIPETETPGFWNNAGICCGLAGVGEFFLDVYGALGDKADLAFARRVADRLLAKATVEDGKMFWVQAEHRTRPDYLFAQTGHMQGAAGVGTFLLRLAAVEANKRTGDPRIVDFATLDRIRTKRIVFPDTPFAP